MSKQFVTLSNGEEIAVWQVKNRVSDTPRYVVHFSSIADSHDEAISLVEKVGGSRYNAVWFNGGVVFESHNPQETLEKLLEA